MPDKQNNMKKKKKTKEYIETLEYFLTFKKANEIEFLQFMTMNKDGDVQEEIKNLINSKIPNFFAGSRAENLNREKADDSIIAKPIQHINPVVCKSTPFYDHNNLFLNGDVVLCCMDYSLDYVIGNLFQEDYYQIFSGEKINEIRKRAMKFGYDKDFICKNCSNASEIVNEDKEHEGWKLSDNVSWQSDLESKKNKFLYDENQKLKEEISTMKKI